MMNKKIIILREVARQIRLDTINLSKEYGIGHIAPSLSIVEILVVLYEEILTNNDNFILSKGHGCLSFYPMLRKRGFNPKILAHPDIDVKNGIECTSGSLGHGLGIAVGKAMAKKIKNQVGYVYVIIGDGESQEGAIWESLNIIRKCNLDNIIPILDYNKFQALDKVGNIMLEHNFKEKFQAFGFNVFDIDGHNIEELIESFNTIKSGKEKLNLILANTIKGKGISFMENVSIWHTRMMSQEELKIAKSEIENA